MMHETACFASEEAKKKKPFTNKESWSCFIVRPSASYRHVQERK